MKKPLILTLIFMLLISTTTFALSSPLVTSPSHPDSGTWTNMSQATFKWNEVDGAIGYSYIIDKEANTEPNNEIDTKENKITKGTSSGTFYFHIKAISETETSATTHYMFKVDSENPAIPANIKVEAKEGYLLVSWEQEPDLLSGISHYHIYKSHFFNFDIRDTGVDFISETNEGQPITGTEFKDYDIEENKSYFYKLRVFDYAGNARLTFAAKGTKALGECSSMPSLVLDLNSTTLSLEVSADETAYDYKVELQKENNETETALFLSKILTSTKKYNFDISKYKDGEINVLISSLDIERDSCAESTSFTIDKTGPSINLVLPKENTTLIENTPFLIKSEDKYSNIDNIKFYKKENNTEKFMGTFSLIDGNYTSEIKPDILGNGNQTLIIKATDSKNNTTEKTFSFISDPLTALEKDVKTNIENSEALLEEITEKITKFKKYSTEFVDITPETETLTTLKTKLENRTLEDSDLPLSAEYKTNLGILKDSFKTITTKQIKLEIQRDIKEALLEQGVKEPFASLSLLNQEKITKIIEYKKYTASEIEQEIATILYEIPITPDTNTSSLLLVEILPKGIDVSYLESDLNFTIIDADPVVAFTIPKEKIKNNKIVFSYTVPANNYAKDNPAGVFGSVPLIIPMPETMPLSEDLISKTDFIFYGTILLVVIILLVAGFFLLKKRPKLPKISSKKKSKGKFSTKGKKSLF